jgi:hypothetical protein
VALGATVLCPANIVPASGSIVCTYSRTLPDGTTRTNTATATQQNYSYSQLGVPTSSGTTNYSGVAPVTFVTPTNVTDEVVTVTDNYPAPGTVLGTVTVGESPKTFTYTRTVAYADFECGDHNIDNTATLTTNDTQTVDTASERVIVHVECVIGCTLTQGYWKTHSSYGPASKADATWLELAGGQGPDTLFFLSNMTWIQVFNTPPKGNAYYQLAHQYMAAKLNILSGAGTTSAVDSAIAGAEALFTAQGAGDTALTSAERTSALNWAGILGSYNEGLIGPGHCDL